MLWIDYTVIKKWIEGICINPEGYKLPKLGNKAKKMILWSLYSAIAFSNKTVWGSVRESWLDLMITTDQGPAFYISVMLKFNLKKSNKV